MATQNPYSDSLLMDAFRGSLSNAESLGRGFAVAPVGLMGDINALARQYITPRLPQSVQGLLQAAPAAPTTEQILSNIPRVSAPRMETSGMEQLGAAMNPRGPVDLARGAGRVAGNAVNEAMVYGRGPLASITPQPMRMVDETAGLLSPTRESFVSGVPAGQEMIVHHNISPEKLARVEQLGGMPVPSLAVSNIENPMMNFGDISLIGAKEMAVPSAKNPVYGFDAYTARAPKIDYSFDAKSSKNLDALFADTVKKIPDGRSELSMVKDEWQDKPYSRIMKAKFLDERGELPKIEDYKDRYDFYAAVQSKVNEIKPEYNGWVNSFDSRLPDAGVNVNERIFKGYTYSGNRKYAPATLENIVKEMKGGAGEEGFFYGVPNIRAVATPKFKTLNQVKAARENIVTSEKFEPIKKQVEDAFNDITGRLGKLEGTAGYSYEPQNALYEIGQTRNVNLLDKLYKDVPEALKADVQVFMNKLREMPTEYFEIKPQRAVQVGEFKGAILPSNAPAQSAEYLRSQGLQDLYYYSTPEERKELFKKFGPEMFAAAPALPLGSGLFGQEEDATGLRGLLGR